MRWLVIGGTSESVAAVKYLLSKQAKIWVSAATDMGAALYGDYPVGLWTGRCHTDEFVEKMKETAITHVLDASHPYAAAVTREVKAACECLCIPYFRYTRRDVFESRADFPQIHRVKDTGEAAALINKMAGRVLLTTGVNTLNQYRSLVSDFQNRCYARVLDNETSIRCCCEIFERQDHWQAENPPFSVEDNRKFIKETGAALLVTKDSGKAGGLPEKLEAAQQENIQVILIDRPRERDILESLNALNEYF